MQSLNVETKINVVDLAFNFFPLVLGATNQYSMTSAEDSLEIDFQILQTRSSQYQHLPPVTERTKKSKKSSGRQNSVKCEHHEDKNNKDTWTAVHSECDLCTRFSVVNTLKECVLPRTVDALNLLLTLKDENNGRSWYGGSAYQECAQILSLRWISCNLYPMPLRTVARDLEQLFDEYRGIKKFSSKSPAYWTKCTPFLQKMSHLFDIQADTFLQSSWFTKTGVKHDKDFYIKQAKNPPEGYSTGKVDKVWEKTTIRKEKREEYLSTLREDKKNKKINEGSENSGNVVVDAVDDEESEDDTSVEYVPESPAKKKKYEYIESFDDADDDIPNGMRNLRSSLRSVRPEVYKVMTLLKSKFHMSQPQAEASIVYVGNILFKRKWKFYDEKQPTDKNTLPAGSNMRRIEPYMEAMALASIVEEVMSGKRMVVTYSNDGSAMSGVGSYVVQSLTIDNVQRVLPTFSIFTESRESLQDLEITTLKILCCAVGYRYTEAEILANIKFVMSDSTSHNLNVIESVCESYNVAPPKALTCNIHPLMMMQRKVKEVFCVLHDTIGAEKLKQCFLSDVDFANDDFITKAIHCLSNFINKDHSAKPWNYHSHFNSHISPRTNKSVTLKDHRFNRLFVCCEGLTYHLDDIASYLDKYRNIVNGITILDRSFVEMPVLKPIFCAAALIGIHITKPFQSLLIDCETKFSTLGLAFPKLYHELTTINPANMCNTSEQVFHFVTKEMFTSGLPDNEVCSIIDECAKEHKDEIVELMKMMISKIADGFDLQRGAIFGFGTHANDDTGTLFKVANATEEEKEELDHTSVHNLGEERSVGSINYEIKIRGKRNLESASRKIVLNKSIDLIEAKEAEEFLSFRKPSQGIAILKKDWLGKMRELENETFASKDDVNSHLDTVKYKDLEFLKSKNGPFVNGEEVEMYLKGDETAEEKNERFYFEVRYAKNTSLRLKHTDAVFRLKRDHKNLTNEEYAENLMNYLGSVRKTSSLTVNDLSDAISKITGRVSTEISNTETVHSPAELRHQSPSSFKPGEHVAVFWIENSNDVVWYLGIVDDETENGKVQVLHLKQTDKVGQKWLLPDNPENLLVDKDQIIVRDISVMYFGVSCRVEISKAMTKEINERLSEVV